MSSPPCAAYNSSYTNAGSINVAVNGQFSPTSCAFNVPVYLPAANVPALGGGNLSFQDIDILGGSLASGSVGLNVICTNTTNLRYVFSGSLTVALGATLTVASNLPVLIASNVTVTDDGTMSFGANDQVTLGVGGLFANTTEQLVAGGGGALSASGVTFTAPSAVNSNYTNTGSINVAVGGQFTPTSSTFNVPVYLPAANVAALGTSNLSFQDIDILGGTLASGSVALTVNCTNTTNLRYVFSASLTVALGATLTVASNLPVLIQSNVTVTDDGTMSFGANDQVTFGVGGLFANTTEQLVVGGALSASGVTFTAPSAYNSSYMNTGSINVAVNGQFTPTSCAFNVPVYLPAANVPGLGSNNLSFQDIDILGGSLASGSVAFNVICTNTTNLRYVFSSNFTVALGATLTVASGLPVLIQSNVTLTDSGTMTFRSGDQVTFGVGGLTSNTTEQLAVSGGGVLSASAATFSAPSAYNSSYMNTGSINVAVNGQFTPTSCAFNVPVYLPAANVPGLGSNNLSFQDIDILGGSLASGSVAFNVICTNTTNLRYVFSSNFTVALGATLTVAKASLPVLIQSNVTVTDSGTMTFGSGDQVTFGVGGLTSNDDRSELAVSGGGAASASAATFPSAPSVAYEQQLHEHRLDQRRRQRPAHAHRQCLQPARVPAGRQRPDPGQQQPEFPGHRHRRRQPRQRLGGLECPLHEHHQPALCLFEQLHRRPGGHADGGGQRPRPDRGGGDAFDQQRHADLRRRRHGNLRVQQRAQRHRHRRRQRRRAQRQRHRLHRRQHQ